MRLPRPTTVKVALFALFVMVLVSLPFAIFGEDFVVPLLKSREQQAGWLTGLAIALLASDAVTPVPSTLVIMFLAAKAGVVAGVVGGTLGMSLGVLFAAWLGRHAVGRVAPRFFPDAELARMREALQRRLVLTLACLRSVPVLAETSVILAAAAGVPTGRIFWATLVPNFLISAIYSVAADDSIMTAVVTFVAIVLASYVVWRVAERNWSP
jgi:3-dehydroquinate synthase